MRSDLFQLSLPAWDLILRACVVFFFVLILLRISGKRQMGQMSATEFVAILLISNAVQNAMNGGDNTLGGGLILAVTLIVMSWLISVLTFRSRSMRLLFEGSPTLMVHKGKIIHKHLQHERITVGELWVLLRKQGIHELSAIYSAVLESDGSLSITRIEDLKLPDHGNSGTVQAE